MYKFYEFYYKCDCKILLKKALKAFDKLDYDTKFYVGSMLERLVIQSVLYKEALENRYPINCYTNTGSTTVFGYIAFSLEEAISHRIQLCFDELKQVDKELDNIDSFMSLNDSIKKFVYETDWNDWLEVMD